MTKRPENIFRNLPQDWGNGWQNVWLIVTAENLEWLRHRFGILLAAPAAVRGVSIEPLLGFTNVKLWSESIDWVIVGGESGPGARPMHPQQVRMIRDDCTANGIPFFFKQWGDWVPAGQTSDVCFPKNVMSIGIDGKPHDPSEPYFEFQQMTQVYRVGKKAAGRELDGQVWSEFPKILDEVAL